MVVSWIGSPLGSNKPVNFFKTNSKDIPVNMFKDNDKDGVANVFDCQPNNKNEQGLIDAMMGAGKTAFSKGGTGNIKRAWQQGMEQKGNPISRNYQSRRTLQTERANKKYSEMGSEQQQAKIIRRVAPMSQRMRLAAKVVSRTSLGTAGLPTSFSEAQRMVRQAHPNYAREAKQRYWQSRLRDPNLTEQQRDKIHHQMAQAANVRATTQRKFRNAAIGVAFPVPSLTSYGSGDGDKTVSGVPGRGRGRPRGSLDRRYAQYGGVFGYRRYVSEQKRALRIQLQKQQPQYEQQQYQQQQQMSQQEQQLPQEMQGQGITPEYSQYQMQQQPVQQYQQEQPNLQMQPPQQNEIRTPFKSSGGSPYPPVSRTPLAQPKQTIPYGYVESVDAFTGRRFMKQLPQKEKWS
jgi:hypothetical protein